MFPDLCSLFSNEAVGRYEGFLLSLSGLSSRFETIAFSNAAANRLRSEAEKIAEVYLDLETRLIEQAADTISQNALRASHSANFSKNEYKLTKTSEAFVGQNKAFLFAELSAQLSRDIEAVIKRFRDLALQINMVQKSTGANRSSALIKLRSNISTKHSYKFRDRAGRQMLSSNFIRLVWRHSMVCLGVEVFLIEASNQGYKTVTVISPNENWNGLIINLSDPTTYLEIKEKVFHPQSEATLKVLV